MHKLSQGAGSHFAHHPPTVCFDGNDRYVQPAAHLFVHPTGHNEGHDLPFAAAQGCIALADLLQLHALAAVLKGSRDRVRDGLQYVPTR